MNRTEDGDIHRNLKGETNNQYPNGCRPLSDTCEKRFHNHGMEIIVSRYDEGFRIPYTMNAAALPGSRGGSVN